MSDEVEMTPIEGAEPPKANPLEKIAPGKATVSALKPAIRPGMKLPTQTALKPGIKLPPKPGATVSALRPGLKLPPKPGATVSALRPGLKLPTQTALKPGIKLPPKPVIHKPGTPTAAMPLPKPVVKAPEAPAAAAPAEAVQTPAPQSAQPVAEVKPLEMPKPMDQLKSVTAKLKGITQEIPQQAILHKTGIIADGMMTEAQKEAAKHKTSRISLSDAMGVAPVKNETAPMKTIRIKRPADIASPTAPLAPLSRPAEKPAEPAATAVAVPASPAPSAQTSSAPAADATPAKPAVAAPSVTMTQRKTLKIARPGGTSVRPSGKFGVKHPVSQATTVVKEPAAAPAASEAAPAVDAVADIPDIPSMPMAPVAAPAPVSEGPAWLWTLSAVVQLAACAAIGALAWFLYENTQTAYF